MSADEIGPGTAPEPDGDELTEELRRRHVSSFSCRSLTWFARGRPRNFRLPAPESQPCRSATWIPRPWSASEPR
jgi:hypothetical protein